MTRVFISITALLTSRVFKSSLSTVRQAGCGAWAFHGWSRALPRWVEVMPVELPGRNSRMREPKQESMAELVNDVVNALMPLFKEKPFALLGHSMVGRCRLTSA